MFDPSATSTSRLCSKLAVEILDVHFIALTLRAGKFPRWFRASLCTNNINISEASSGIGPLLYPVICIEPATVFAPIVIEVPLPSDSIAIATISPSSAALVTPWTKGSLCSRNGIDTQ